MKRFESPVTVVCVTALCVATAFAVIGYFRFRAKTVDPRVTLEFGRVSTGNRISAGKGGIPSTIDGEVARTADRIGEAAALVIAVDIYAAGQQIKGHTPRTVQDLLSGVAAQGLLPPGCGFTKDEGVLASPRGKLAVRYRPLPLGIEVISLGNKAEDGPALMVRVPDELSDKGEAKLFIAGSLTDVKVPTPFANSAEVIALGWSPERLRSLK